MFDIYQLDMALVLLMLFRHNNNLLMTKHNRTVTRTNTAEWNENKRIDKKKLKDKDGTYYYQVYMVNIQQILHPFDIYQSHSQHTMTLNQLDLNVYLLNMQYMLHHQLYMCPYHLCIVQLDIQIDFLVVIKYNIQHQPHNMLLIHLEHIHLFI
jgi:hypothetical protein